MSGTPDEQIIRFEDAANGWEVQHHRLIGGDLNKYSQEELIRVAGVMQRVSGLCLDIKQEALSLVGRPSVIGRPSE